MIRSSREVSSAAGHTASLTLSLSGSLGWARHLACLFLRVSRTVVQTRKGKNKKTNLHRKCKVVRNSI